MQLAQVEGFVEVAHRGNLSRAAESLFITQPALTARLRVLEHEVGTALFRRGGRGMQLTEPGRAFLPYAERALRTLRDGVAMVGQLPIAEALVLGAAPAISTYTLPGLLVSFAEARPEARLIVRTGHSEEILDQVLRGDLDVGLIRALNHPDLESLLILEDELVLVADPGHALARRRRITPSQIGEARLILFDRTSSFYELTSRLFRQAGSPPRGVLELDNIDAAKRMVLAGLGVALLPRTAVDDELATGRLRSIELVGTPPVERRIVAVRRRERGATSPAADAFWQLLRDLSERR
ncbi:MAG TPA: LysR family transcriptional regulator [Candidatus Limnocylindrales bacterium]|nr:LysR family transcriptional regulator [Candidatus Limnocylindrales bacterium]